MLAEIKDPDVRIYAVWASILKSDFEIAVGRATKHLPDERVSHYWDGEGELVKAYGRVLKLGDDETAWDVYYVYGRDAEWGGSPPVPGFFMDQVGLPGGQPLDGDKLAAEMRRLLSRQSNYPRGKKEMSKKRVIAATVTALVLAVCADAALAATRTTTIYVTGMTCAGCAISIEQVLKSTEGVEEVRVSFERGEAVVKYDDRKVTAARLREAINGIGYRATARPPRKGRGAKPKAPACCGAESCDTQPPG